MPPVTPNSVLAECHAAGKTGVFILGDHALLRANQRRIGRADIRQALVGVTEATLQDNGRWLVSGGTDLEGATVTFIVTLYRGLVVITLY